MTFSEKLLRLRRQAGLSQEELAERLQVSRQAISRWELGTALPDAPNLLALSKLFAVSTDYLLREEWESDRAADGASAKPEQTEEEKDRIRQAVLLGILGVSAMGTVLAAALWWVLQVDWAVLLALALHVACAGGFEAAFRCLGASDAGALRYRRKFYRIFVWLAAFFPLQLFSSRVLGLLWPRAHSALLEPVLGLALYLLLCLTVCWCFRERKA
ncbi:MAG: helix-turn-helix domain-containing protein [Oscillospiraceae bacterium]